MASFFMQASKSPTTYMFGALVPIQLWFFDRLLEEKRERIRALARELAMHGSVQLAGSSQSEKDKAWAAYLPHLLNTWSEASGGTFRLDDESTWPDFPSGRPHPYTHKGNDWIAQSLPAAAAASTNDDVSLNSSSRKPSSRVGSISNNSSSAGSSNTEIIKARRTGSEYPIRLHDDHSECQAVCCAAIDSALDGKVHWGHDRTHWKARLLMGPRIFPFLYCLCPSLLPTGENSLVLDDPDIVWGITVFPVKHKEATIHANSTSANSGGSNSSSHDRSISNSSNSSEEHDSIVGKATPRHAHIDGGRASIFQDQLIRPNEMEPTEGDAAEPFSLNEALMQIPASQLSVQLHCCTPGDLGPAQGSTGIYRGSHLLVAGALRQALLETTPTASAGGSGAGSGGGGGAVTNEDVYALPWSALEVALKNASELYAANHPLGATSDSSASAAGSSTPKTGHCEDQRPLAGLLEQPHLKNGNVLLIHGATVHGTMRCAKSMPALSSTASPRSSYRASDSSSEPTDEYPSTAYSNTLPRVIMNAKAFVASSLEEAKSGATARRLEKFTAALPEGSSAARDAALDPRALWVKSGRSGDDFDRRVNILANEIIREAAKSKMAAPHVK